MAPALRASFQLPPANLVVPADMAADINGPTPGIKGATTETIGAIFLATFFKLLPIFFKKPNSGLPVIGLIDIPPPTVYSAGSKPMLDISCSNLCLVSGVITGGTTISPWAT